MVGQGLVGDRYRGRASRSRRGPKRQVSLVAAEHLPIISGLVGRDLDAALLRRNLVVRGIPLRALMRLRFSIGDVLLEGSGPCDPCSRMEELLGPGGYAAMQGMGGIVARVIEGGTMTIGDSVLSRGLPPEN